MKPHFLSAAFLLIFAFCCTSKEAGTTSASSGSVTSVVANRHEFLDFIHTLTEVKLPYEINCADCCGEGYLDSGHPIAKKYIPAGSRLIGTVFADQHYVALLVTYTGDMIIPSVVVYDVTGRKIDERNFMTGCCGGDPHEESRQYFQISEHHMLTEIDTTLEFEMDDSVRRVGVSKLEALRQDYVVNRAGKIVHKE